MEAARGLQSGSCHDWQFPLPGTYLWPLAKHVSHKTLQKSYGK